MIDLPIEFARSYQPRVIRHVLMDWDGTTSLTCGGWTEITATLSAENLPPLAVEHEAKREMLLAAGADGVVADFHHARQIVEALIAS